MHINIITLFPEFFAGPLSSSLMQRAREAGIVSFSLVNPRDMADDRHHTADDRPYGGGPGMVMLAQPVAKTLRSLGFVPEQGLAPGRLIYLSPKGRPLSQALARELAGQSVNAAAHGMSAAAGQSVNAGAHGMNAAAGQSANAAAHGMSAAAGQSVNAAAGQSVNAGAHGMNAAAGQDSHALAGQAATATVDRAAGVPAGQDVGAKGAVLTLICGRYEGLDARIEALFPVETVSVGDFVLNGGESAALCLVEAVTRLLPGYMGHEESGEDESFSASLLEYPHYTRPENFEGLSVPEVLTSGDHGKIALWRKQASLLDTVRCRPDILPEAELAPDDYAFLQNVPLRKYGKNLYCALVHHPVLDKIGNSVTVSLTNMDIHDIARSSCTYGLGGYYVVTPLQDQRELLESILSHWSSGSANPDRDRALSLVRAVSAIHEAISDIRRLTGQDPLVVGTSASPPARGEKGLPPVWSFGRIAEGLRHAPVLLLFGTGHGLAPQVNALCHAFAPALRWHGGYNHLSVRSAAAIILDRILGDWR